MTSTKSDNRFFAVEVDWDGMIKITDYHADKTFLLYKEEAQELCYRLGITLQNLNSSNPPPDQL